MEQQRVVRAARSPSIEKDVAHCRDQVRIGGVARHVCPRVTGAATCERAKRRRDRCLAKYRRGSPLREGGHDPLMNGAIS